MDTPEITPTLRQYIEAIAQQGSPDEVGDDWGQQHIEPLGDIWDVMNLIFTELGHEDAADLLADAVHASRLTCEQAAEALNYGNWAGDLNPVRTCSPTLDRWILAGDDPIRVFIALKHETFRLDEGIQFLEILIDLRQRWPELAPLCDKWRRDIIEQRLIHRNGPVAEANTLTLWSNDESDGAYTVSLSDFVWAVQEKIESSPTLTDSNPPTS